MSEGDSDKSPVAYRSPLRQALLDDNTGHVNLVVCEADYEALKPGIEHLPPPVQQPLQRPRADLGNCGVRPECAFSHAAAREKAEEARKGTSEQQADSRVSDSPLTH